MLSFDEKVDLIISLAVNGKLGTPDNPNRGSSGKVAFWNSYFNRPGIYDPKSKRQKGYEYVIAGQKFRKQS